MRPEKEYLVREAADHLEKSNFFFVTDYHGINAEETTELRNRLAQRGAEFHVVKNSSLRIVAKEKEIDDISDYLVGHSAIVVGGDDASGVAKDLNTYFKEKDKVSVKCGALDNKVLTADEVKKLANLPSLDIIRAQLLSLINSPASQLLSILNQPARGFVTLLQAKAEKP
jgi:large subunit ribosomal protein L10